MCETFQMCKSKHTRMTLKSLISIKLINLSTLSILNLRGFPMRPIFEINHLRMEIAPTKVLV